MTKTSMNDKQEYNLIVVMNDGFVHQIKIDSEWGTVELIRDQVLDYFKAMRLYNISHHHLVRVAKDADTPFYTATSKEMLSPGIPVCRKGSFL